MLTFVGGAEGVFETGPDLVVIFSFFPESGLVRIDRIKPGMGRAIACEPVFKIMCLRSFLHYRGKIDPRHGKIIFGTVIRHTCHGGNICRADELGKDAMFEGIFVAFSGTWFACGRHMVWGREV